MISVSRIRGRVTQLGRLICLAGLMGLATAAGCSDRSCSAIGCLAGLHIHLEGTFSPGGPSEILITEPPRAAPLMTCTFTGDAPDAAAELVCLSGLTYVQFGRTINIQSTELRKIAVAVSFGGFSQGEQTFEPIYTSREFNGSGCGTCTTASVHVTIP